MHVQQLPDGRFDIQDEGGNSVLGELGGPFRSRRAAEEAARMLTAFDRVDKRIEQINDGLRQSIVS